jgi:tRNA(fMet)-specific endonuclease VapC
MTALLDTDTVIYLLRGLRVADPRSARQRQWQEMGQRIFQRARAWSARGRDVALSAITVAELEFGARHCADYEAEREILHRALTPFTMLDFDAGDCTRHYGEIRHVLESAGKPIGSLDMLIAAHARAIGATLITNNTAEFSRVPGLELANWTEA